MHLFLLTLCEQAPWLPALPNLCCTPPLLGAFTQRRHTTWNFLPICTCPKVQMSFSFGEAQGSLDLLLPVTPCIDIFRPLIKVLVSSCCLINKLTSLFSTLRDLNTHTFILLQSRGQKSNVSLTGLKSSISRAVCLFGVSKGESISFLFLFLFQLPEAT